MPNEVELLTQCWKKIDELLARDRTCAHGVLRRCDIDRLLGKISRAFWRRLLQLDLSLCALSSGLDCSYSSLEAQETGPLGMARGAGHCNTNLTGRSPPANPTAKHTIRHGRRGSEPYRCRTLPQTDPGGIRCISSAHDMDLSHSIRSAAFANRRVCHCTPQKGARMTGANSNSNNSALRPRVYLANRAATAKTPCPEPCQGSSHACTSNSCSGRSATHFRQEAPQRFMTKGTTLASRSQRDGLAAWNTRRTASGASLPADTYTLLAHQLRGINGRMRRSGVLRLCRSATHGDSSRAAGGFSGLRPDPSAAGRFPRTKHRQSTVCDLCLRGDLRGGAYPHRLAEAWP